MFQVHRTDTGQFVLLDPATGVVVVEDELQTGYERIEALAAERPPTSAAPQPELPGTGSAFEFRGRRNLSLILTIGLPFVWFLFVYLALHDLDRPASDVQEQLDALHVEIASMRSELSGAGKHKPKRNKKGGAKKNGKGLAPDEKAEPKLAKKPGSTPRPPAARAADSSSQPSEVAPTDDEPSED